MSLPYSVGDDVELSFTIGSSQSTAPETAAVYLVVTPPSTDGTPPGYGVRYPSSSLTTIIPSSDSTAEGWATWQKLITATRPGRWTYQFTSTGTVLTSMGGAFAVARPLASTST